MGFVRVLFFKLEAIVILTEYVQVMVLVDLDIIKPNCMVIYILVARFQVSASGPKILWLLIIIMCFSHGSKHGQSVRNTAVKEMC